MTLLAVILGVAFQAFLALFSFMAVAFAAGASLPDGILVFLLDWALIGIPVVSVCVAIASIVLYMRDASAVYNWLHAIPVALLVAFFVLRF